MNDRCPWCGKKIDYHYDSRRVNKKKIPMFFVFACCSNCDKYYGQSVYTSKYMKTMLLLGVAAFAAAFLGVTWAPIAWIAAVLPTPYFMPFSRMTKDETPVLFDEDAKYSSKYECDGAIKRHSIYFLTDKFDENMAFACVSPIYIDSVDKSNEKTVWHFLYDHPENKNYLSQSSFAIYDGNMKYIGKITAIQNPIPTQP